MKTKTTFSHLYSFPGFRARARFKSGILGDQKARVVELNRRQKKRFVQSASDRRLGSTITGSTGCATSIPEICGFTWNSSTGGWTARDAEV